MLTTLKKVVTDAQKGGYAVGAFNIENMEMAQAVIAAAEEMRSPVIMQTTPSTLKYATPELYFANVCALAEAADVPVVMHLDHGNSFELAARAFRAGYTSIMIDGSQKSLEENISLTKSVVAMCAPGGVSVEAELGCVGGKEDDLVGENMYTDPDTAARFAEETGIDALAVAIGTAHGVYKETPKLDIDRLEKIHQLVSVPLVLHGTSGVEDEMVKKCVERGICKVNYATDLRIAFTKGVKEVLEENPNVFDPKKYNAKGREYVKQYVMDKMAVCGSAGKA